MKSPLTPAFLLIALASALVIGCASSAPTVPMRIPQEPMPKDFQFTADFEVEPRLRFTPRTVFPPFLVNQGARGKATVDFLITPQGRVTQTRLDNATHQAFGASALSTVSRMEFYPALKAGSPVAVAARVTFVFDYEP